MALTYVNVGKQNLQQDVVNKEHPGDYIMILYTARATPTAVLSDLTECTAAGYAAVTMTGTSWSVTSASPAVATAPQVSFTLTGTGSDLLGYAIKRGTVLIGWEDFSSAKPVPAAGLSATIEFSQNLT